MWPIWGDNPGPISTEKMASFDQVYMSRTKAEVSPEVMSSGSHWEFFAGNDGVSPHDIAAIWVAFFSIYIVAAGQGEVGG